MGKVIWLLNQRDDLIYDYLLLIPELTCLRRSSHENIDRKNPAEDFPTRNVETATVGPPNPLTIEKITAVKGNVTDTQARTRLELSPWTREKEAVLTTGAL